MKNEILMNATANEIMKIKKVSIDKIKKSRDPPEKNISEIKKLRENSIQ